MDINRLTIKSQEFGARPMRRLIARELMAKLAMKMLPGSYSDGETVRVDYLDGLVFHKLQSSPVDSPKLEAMAG